MNSPARLAAGKRFVIGRDFRPGGMAYVLDWFQLGLILVLVSTSLKSSSLHESLPFCDITQC